MANPDVSLPVIIGFDDTEGFDHGDFRGQVYIPKDAELGINALFVVVDGRHPRKRIGEGNTRMYTVLQGDGTFELDDVPSKVKQGDTIVIPAGHEYSYAGKMALWEVNVSPDNSFKDKTLE